MNKNITILFLLRMLRVAFGIVIIAVSAHYFGVSFDRDIWLLAFNFVTLLDLALWGPINETFRAKFVFIREKEGLNIALVKTRSLIAITFLLCSLFVIILIVFRFSIVKVIAPSFTQEQEIKLALMLLLIAPAFLINQLTQIGISILNSFNVFFIPELSSFVSAIVNILIIITLAPYMGIKSLAISYYISIVILLFLVVFQLIKLKVSIFPKLKDLYSKEYLSYVVFAAPFFLPYFLGQLSGIAEKSIASTLGGGAVSILDYSRKFSDILFSVMSSVLATMLVPILSSKFSNKEYAEFNAAFSNIYHLAMFLLAFIIAFFTVSSFDVVCLLFDHGSISPENLERISATSKIYIWACLPVFFYTIFGLALMSSNQAKIYAILGMLAQIILLILNYSLYTNWGITTFPINLFISHFMIGMSMLLLFPFKSHSFFRDIFKYFVFMALTVIVTYLFRPLTFIFSNVYVRLCLSATSTIVIMIFMMFLLKLEERNYFIKPFSKIT